MSFKFEFKIDYSKLTSLLDKFLKSHSDELTSIMGQCLVLEPSNNNNNLPVQEQPIIQAPERIIEPDQTIDNRPLIGDSIPEDPLSNLFGNPNADTTRYKDRNNIYNKKWNHDKQ